MRNIFEVKKLGESYVVQIVGNGGFLHTFSLPGCCEEMDEKTANILKVGAEHAYLLGRESVKTDLRDLLNSVD